MKKFYAILVLSVLFLSSTFAVKNCVFIVKTNATADQNIIDHLNANGYAVTVSVANGTVPAGSYDLAVISETNGSGDAVWKAFKTAALPFVGLKTFSAKSNTNSLSWLTTAVTGTDYANTTDISVTSAAPTHAILNGVPENPQFLNMAVVDATVTPNITSALQWLKFPTLPSGATVITTVTIGTGTTYTVTGQIPQTIAFNNGTVMNNNTLTNRAVLSGFNYLANAQLTTNALKVIKQSCDWVSDLGVLTSVQKPISENLLEKNGFEIVNPSNTEVVVYNSVGVRVMNSKASSIHISNLKKGVYIAKSTSGTLKFSL